jgi:hypothetical protein
MVKVGTPEVAKKEPLRLTIGDEGLTGDFPMKLSPLLEKRRLEYAIPDCAFRRRATFGRCLLWQFTDDDAKFPGTSLYMPEATKARSKEEAPRGVLITAGLQDLDFLWANGMEPGSIVNWVRLSPWRMPVGFIKGTEIKLHVCRAREIVACEDLELEADHEVVLDEKHGLHQLKVDGKIRPRADIEPSDDY